MRFAPLAPFRSQAPSQNGLQDPFNSLRGDVGTPPAPNCYDATRKMRSRVLKLWVGEVFSNKFMFLYLVHTC